MKKLFLLLLVLFLPLFVIANTLYEYYNSNDDDYNNLAITPERMLGQSFTPVDNYWITSVKLKTFRVGSPGNIYLYLYDTTGGLPTGATTSQGKITGNDWTESTNGDWYEWELDTFYEVASGTKYAIAIYAPNSVWGTDIIGWRMDYSGATYSGGSSLTQVGGNWSVYKSDADYMFEIYGTTTAPVEEESEAQEYSTLYNPNLYPKIILYAIAIFLIGFTISLKA